MNELKNISVPMLNQLDKDKWDYINKWIKYIYKKKSVDEPDYYQIKKEADDLMDKYWPYGKRRTDSMDPADEVNNHYIYNIMTSAMDVVLDFAKRFDVKKV